MTTEITLPELGDGIESGDVLQVLVAEGDDVAKDQPIVELETDKATVEVPSTLAGRVVKVFVSSGQTVAVGGALIAVEAAAASTVPAASPDPVETEQAAVGTPPKEGPAATPEPTLESSASSAQVPASAELDTPTPSASSVSDETPVESENDVSRAGGKSKAAASQSPGQIAAGPAIRRLAREVGVDLSRVRGSGEGQRITRDDVMNVVRAGGNAASDARDSLSDAWGPIRIEPLSKIRKTIASKMHESWTTAPRVTNFDDADVTKLEQIRQSSKGDYAEKGIKLTSMPFIIKAVAMALRDHPVINASLNTDQGNVVYKEYVNVGIAVDTERGLMVPSLREADKMAIPDIARELMRVAEKVRSNSFSIDDLRGSTFTISNLGAIGGTYSTPIINVPEVAILLVGRSRKLPVVVDDEVQIRLMMPLSLSYDHRLVDGGAAARFLNDVIGFLKAPSRLFLAP